MTGLKVIKTVKEKIRNEKESNMQKVTERTIDAGKKRRLTLQNLISENQEIWVRNQSGKITGKEAGNIVFQVGQGQQIDVVTVPAGNDPICLTDQVTPKMLSECMDLFKLVKSGALELLDPSEADSYYTQNQARKIAVAKKLEKFSKQEKEEAKPKKASSSTVHVNHKLGDICLKAKHAAITEQEALERLFEQESVLTVDDYNYVIANGVYNGVKSWAKDQLKKVMES